MPNDDPTKEPQVVPYADQNPQTVHITDGLRCRKTDSGFVVERLKSDDTWEALDAGGGGGLLYVDVVLNPVDISTLPFTDPTFAGAGVLVVDAPGENLYIFPSSVFALVSPGDNWTQNADPTLYWGSGAGAIAMLEITDGLDGTSYSLGMQSSGETGGDNAYQAYPPNLDKYDTTLFVNQPLVMLNSQSSMTGGSRSITYRIYYRILPYNVPTELYYLIVEVNQGTKTITVNGDRHTLTGSIDIVGSTGNDGTYTIVSATYVDDAITNIVVMEDLPDATSDGWLKQ